MLMSIQMALLLESILKAATKKNHMAKELIEAWIAHNTNENRLTFASLCDWWIQLRKQKMQKEQVETDIIDEIYAEFLVLGEKEFIKKYIDLSGIYVEIYKDIEYRRTHNGKDPPRIKRNLTADWFFYHPRLYSLLRHLSSWQSLQ